MDLATKRLLRYLCLLFGVNLGIPTPAVAEDSVTWFVSMQHLVIPMRTNVEPKVSVDSMARTVELTFGRLRKSDVRHLRAQIRTGGAKMLWARNRGRQTKILLQFSFRNLLVLHSVKANPRRFVMDVGTGRYMMPQAPWAAFSQQVKDPSEKKILLSSERYIASGKPARAVAQLEKLATKSSDGGLLACIRLADIAMLERQTAKAGILADACLHRVRQNNSPLESLAMLRKVSYRGYLFSTQLELQLADLEPEPGAEAWIAAEYYYQLARVHFARGEYEKALSRAVMLARAFDGSKRASDISMLAISAMDRIVERDRTQGKFASISVALLDGVRWIRPIPAAHFTKLVNMTADALLKAGAPHMAADLLTWHLRNMSGKRVDKGLLKLLSMAFLKVGDSYRAGRTLDFLLAQRPARTAKPDVLELRSMVLMEEGRKAQAIDALVTALGSTHNTRMIQRIALKVGTLLQASGEVQKGLDLVTSAVARVSGKKKGRGFSELLLLQADLAYSLKNLQIASAAYESFVRLNPKDERRQMALYRLQRLGRDVIDLLQVSDMKDTTIWSRANDAFRDSVSLAGVSP